ncbi:MAG TPA: spiro-SPASM protein [Spirochaetia bacterium]|nr:spiro-SPASM protein [Spirochaetia bacterium]
MNIAIVNAIDVRPPATRPLVNGTTSFQRVMEFARGLPGVEQVTVLASTAAGPLPETPRNCRVIARAQWSVADLTSEMEKACQGFEDVFYVFADCPFLDPAIAQTMHANHRKYWADYTFADGFPLGLTPEILTRDVVSRLRGMSAEDRGRPDREALFAIIRKDINSFDIETELAPVDLRLLRVSLTADTERNFLLLRRLIEKGGSDTESICRLLQEEPRVLRTLPAFFPIQIVERCPYACSYCPYPAFAGDVTHKNGAMDAQKFSALVAKIAAFCGDAVIDVSLWGEPSLHPEIFAVLSSVLGTPGLSLVIETSGLGWGRDAFRRLKDSFPTQPTWIVSLDASSEEMYRRLRGPGYAEAVKTAEILLSLFPSTTWVQAVRMKENEEDLEVFYKSWKTKTDNIIIQKYDSFSTFLPDRKVADLSPVRRFPCWHLKRDMAILIDGTVPMCREDVRVEHRVGNAFTEDLAVIWERGERAYRNHIAESYPPLCAGCDEYYTYNF